jgi:hypothetical protein
MILQEGRWHGSRWISSWKVLNVMDRCPNHLACQSVATEAMKRPRNGPRRCAAPFVVAFMCVITSIWGEAAYLPMVGPAPLRFRPPPLPKPVNFVLSPPVPPPSVEMPPVIKPEPPVVTIVRSSGQDSDSGQLGDLFDVTPTNEVISTKMLLKYFNHAPYGNPSNAKTPFGFIPPPPSESQPVKGGEPASVR